MKKFTLLAVVAAVVLGLASCAIEGAPSTTTFMEEKTTIVTQVKIGETITIPAPVEQKDGTFEGWTTNPLSHEKLYKKGDDYTISNYGVIFYPVYSYVITYDFNNIYFVSAEDCKLVQDVHSIKYYTTNKTPTLIAANWKKEDLVDANGNEFNFPTKKNKNGDLLILTEWIDVKTEKRYTAGSFFDFGSKENRTLKASWEPKK